MTFTRFLAAGAATVAVAVAVPAAAQGPYPYAQPYPQQYPQTGYGYPGQQGYAQDPLGAIIGQLLGNRYNIADRNAVERCASAAMTQAAAQYGSGYGDNGYGQGYGQLYGYNGGGMRVSAITNVERRNNGLRVSGLLSSGMGAHGSQGYSDPRYGAYGSQGYSDPRYGTRGNLSFRCNVDYRGAVTNIRIRRA